jgi:hypothetical protein
MLTDGQKIARHAAVLADPTPKRRQWDDNALVEICQLIFNICQFYPDLATDFNVSVANLFSIVKTSAGDPPLKQPVAAAINALLNSDFFSETWKNSAFPQPDPTVHVSMLISILIAAFEKYPDSSLNKLALPLTALIHKMYSVGPPQVKELVKQKLLPSDADRNQVLGKGTSFSARLLRLTNTPSTPNLGESISILLYALSDNDAEKFVHNVGLGYGAGYLMKKGIPLPTAAKETGDASGADINPITGQRRDAEVEDTMPPMTDEEKEQEAEKLFVLFERFVASRNTVKPADDEQAEQNRGYESEESGPGSRRFGKVQRAARLK